MQPGLGAAALGKYALSVGVVLGRLKALSSLVPLRKKSNGRRVKKGCA
jgi:hypothetical protein